MKKISLVLVFTLLLAGMAGCTDLLHAEKKDIIYQNKQIDFSLALPGYWEDRYHIEESDSMVRFYHKVIWIQTGEGLLFTITRFKPKDKWNKEGKELEEMIGLQKIYESDSEVFTFSLPTDVQNISRDESVRAEYAQMQEDLTRVKNSFQKSE